MRLDLRQQAAVDIGIYSCDGRIVFRKTINTTAGKNLNYSMPADLRPDLYIIHFVATGASWAEAIACKKIKEQ